MQDNAGQQYLPGFWCGVARGFVQGPHMAYSSASDVKSFALIFVIALGLVSSWVYTVGH